MKSFLISQLKRSATKHRDTLSTDTIITDVNRLLEEKANDDYQMLKAMRMSASTDHKLAKHGKLITINQKLKDYGEVFHIDEIKDIACKYALKFLNSKHYKGAIDHSMFQKIRQFGQDKKLPIDEASLGYKMYILAPPSAFKLSYELRDPLMFYKLDEEHFVFVCRWGNDFTFTRRLLGLQRLNLFTLISSMWLPALLFICLCVFLKSDVFTIPIVASIIFGIFSTICAGINYDMGNGENVLWGKVWNNKYKVRIW